MCNVPLVAQFIECFIDVNDVLIWDIYIYVHQYADDMCLLSENLSEIQ